MVIPIVTNNNFFLFFVKTNKTITEAITQANNSALRLQAELLPIPEDFIKSRTEGMVGRSSH